MTLHDAEFQATIPATDLDGARRFYEEKLGLSPERVMEAGIVYRFGKGSAFLLYPADRPEPNTRSARGWSTI